MQKTAYGMRISDWRSDVCSSDLHLRGVPRLRGVRRAGRGAIRPGARPGRAPARTHRAGRRRLPAAGLHPLPVPRPYARRRARAWGGARVVGRRDRVPGPGDARGRDRAGRTCRIGCGPPALVQLRGRGSLLRAGRPAARPRARRGQRRTVDLMSETGLSVTVLGCSGTYAGPGGACSGYLLRTASTTIWMDCGAGSLANLQRHVPLVELDGVVVSHSHPDHWLELPVALNALRYVLDVSDLGLPLLWTSRTAAQFAAVGADPSPTFDPRVIDERSTATIGDLDLRFSRTAHPVETPAIRTAHDGRASTSFADQWVGRGRGAAGHARDP